MVLQCRFPGGESASRSFQHDPKFADFARSARPNSEEALVRSAELPQPGADPGAVKELVYGGMRRQSARHLRLDPVLPLQVHLLQFCFGRISGA